MVPNVLAEMERKVPNINSLWLRRIPSRTDTTMDISKTYNLCSSNILHVKSIRFSSEKQDIEGSNLSKLLSYIVRCTSISMIEISSNLVSVPKFHSSGVVTLNLSSNNIQEMESNSWTGLVNIRILDLSDNKFVRIPSGAFKVNRKLKSLLINRNTVSFITRQSFLGK